LRQPSVVDNAAFAFPTVMGQIAGGKDAAVFVDAWLSQLGANLTVGDKQAAARPKAAAYLQAVPRLPDGRLDLNALGFQTTSLSNRIDLAGPSDCGEARITYALGGGLTDRRHRMTVIVELKQPDDGARCATVASRWIALGRLDGDALTAAVQAIYAPLLSPQHLGQVRTNEFLVGPDDGSLVAWELREWRLGTDGALHLALSKQAVDGSVSSTAPFIDWLAQNNTAVLAQQVTIPDAFLAVTSSEDGSRIPFDATVSVSDALANSLNRMACAGCHTTEFNTAFAHVAERFGGSGRAQISEFLRGELPHRGQHLFQVGLGRLDETQRAAPKSVH
jgi:hypothetical protein